MLPDHEIDELMEMQNIASECREEFQKAMDFAAFRYETMKGNTLDWGSIRTQTDDLRKKASKLIKAFDDFEAVLRGFDTLSRNPVRDHMDITLNRESFQFADIQRYRDLVKADIKQWRDAAKATYGDVASSINVKGNPFYRQLVADLVEAYAAAGKEPGISRTKDNYRGPMLRFVKDCIDRLGVEKKPDSALGKTLEKVIRDRKKFLSEPVS